MKAIIIAVFAIVISSEAHALNTGQFQQKDCKPDDTLLHFSDCMSNPQVKLLGVEFLIYPLDLHKPINLTLTMNNTGDRITSIIQYIDIDWYGYLLNCGWHNLFSIPNVDGCSQLGNCPQEPGLVVSHVNIDTAPYEGAIDLLPIDQVYLRFTIDSYDQHTKHISCVDVRGLACKASDC